VYSWCRLVLGLISLDITIGGSTAKPGGLHVRLCHAFLHCVSKNDNDVLRYNFNAYQPILIIFGRDIAE